MTREEAIRGLETLSKYFSGYKPNEEMFEMAISALKAQTDGDIISRQAAIDVVEESRRLNHHQDGKEACAHEYEHRHFLKILRDLPPARPDNQVNLCDSCKHTYPDCQSGKDDVIFGNGIGNDNICACAKYVPSTQPEPSQIARDIATIIENEQDMRVILKNAQNDIIHCEDCRFRHKSPDWKHLQSFGSSIWYCGKAAETVNLDDYCSSAERRTDEND